MPTWASPSSVWNTWEAFEGTTLLGYAVAIAFGAFLLFQVQPLIGKYILPWFGGGPAVWTTCMLFFQMLLLAGYAYAHLLHRWLAPRMQAAVHVVVLGAAMLALPIVPNTAWKPTGGGDPTFRILALLAATVGLPYLVLATTSPLLQAWFTRAQPGRSPYRLYALSNAGSLLALVSYPFVVEPWLRLRAQALVWSMVFAVFALVCGWCAVRVWRMGSASDDSRQDGGDADAAGRPGVAARILWIALPACGSLLLLAVTNQMCSDVAIVPFLWVLPLTLYLLTFILCFHSERWYVRPFFWGLLTVCVAGMIALLVRGVYASIALQVCGFSGGLFVCCMVCHGELVRLKPHPRHLTAFYLSCSAGGALGGVFVGLVAPNVFHAYLELHIGLWLCCALAMVAFWVERRPHRRWSRSWAAMAWLPAFVLVMAVLTGALCWDVQVKLRGSLSLSRNFYGTLRVARYSGDTEAGDHYSLQHGRILHGSQFISPARRREPTTYFGPQSGIGLALRLRRRQSPLRVGVVGLGTGTIAAYGEAGDHYTFYEINPQVKHLATSRFTYLTDSEADCDVALGDARISLERQKPQHFDVLALDAFTSDAIPIHLLTREAFAAYSRHLKPDAIVAVHISNRFLDLEPVVAALAEEFGFDTAIIESESDVEQEIDAATWVLLTADQNFLDDEQVVAATRDDEDGPPVSPLLWTDDYSSLAEILR